MVQALRANRKTVTRRTRGLDKINGEPDAWVVVTNEFDRGGSVHCRYMLDSRDDVWIRCPYGLAGDRLWTKETWGLFDVVGRDCGVGYRADHPDGNLARSDGGYNWLQVETLAEAAKWAARVSDRWRPSIHMPRWASRDTLEVVSVRPERLHDITEVDAEAEGVEKSRCGQDQDGHAMEPLYSYRTGFVRVWREIHGPGSWAKNPWVWRVEFCRLKGAK